MFAFMLRMNLLDKHRQHFLFDLIFRKMNSYEAILSSASTKFSKLVKKPEKFLEPSPELFEEIKLLNKDSSILFLNVFIPESSKYR